MLPIVVFRTRKQGTAGKALRTLYERVCCAHRTQISHKRSHRTVTDNNLIDIGNRHCKAGPLKQSSRCPDIHEWQDARGCPLADRGFAVQQAVAQLIQRARTRKASNQQSVGRHQPLQLDQDARRVVGFVQQEETDNEVKTLAVGPIRTNCLRLVQTVHAIDCCRLRFAGLNDLFSNPIGQWADTERSFKVSINCRQAFFKIIERPRKQKICPIDAKSFSPRTIARNLVMVNNLANTHGFSIPAGSRTLGLDMRLDELGTSLKRPVSAMRSMLFPDLCLGCSAHVASQGTLCPECWAQLAFIERPYCEVTGIPFAHEFGDRIVSAAAIADPPRYDRARAVAIHDNLARRLVTRLKYADRTDLAPWMARWMKRAGNELIADSDIIVPVPLHRLRFWTRRYNQSAELARALATQTGKPMVPDVLVRTRQTRQQVGLGQRERTENVRGAFAVPDRAQIKVQGRNILLIDDVMTTGATIDAACKALRKAKSGRIDVLTFSRVVTRL